MSLDVPFREMGSMAASGEIPAAQTATAPVAVVVVIERKRRRFMDGEDTAMNGRLYHGNAGGIPAVAIRVIRRSLKPMDELNAGIVSTAVVVPVGAWRTLREAHENALVVLAMGLDCSVHALGGGGGGYELLVDAEDAAAARAELALYAGEQVFSRPAAARETAPDHPVGWAWFVAWAAALVMVFAKQMELPEITDRFANSSSALMDGGEWWRPFTSLFLHADGIHLLGNLLIGGIFCGWVSKSIGAWRAWPLILLGGTLANGVNAALHEPGDFSSIGASTATFAALGILVGLGIVEMARSGSSSRLRSLAIPLVAGLMLFSLFGISGDRTDIGGHAWGGMFGTALGAVSGWLRWGNSPSSARRSGEKMTMAESHGVRHASSNIG